MKMTISLRCLLAAAALSASCASGDGASERGDRLIPACAVPAAANTYDAGTGVGCSPRTMFQVCEVPSGSIVHADGTITTPAGTTVSCSNRCTPEEYALDCTGLVAEHPVPDPALGCEVIPVPTPGNAAYYCCPCAL